MRKGKHAVLGLAALISAAAIGGTWASWTQELKAGNEFMTGSYNTSLDETFESPKNWKPGEKTEKAVQITNKGAVDAMAKGCHQSELGVLSSDVPGPERRNRICRGS